MKIGIDARFLGTNSRGPERYVAKLLEELALLKSNHYYFIFVSNEKVLNKIPLNWQVITAPYRWYGWAEQIYFPYLLRRYNLDIMHFCHFNVPLFYRRPFIVTIHDLILLKFKGRHISTRNWLYFYIKYLGFRLVIASAINRSKKIIAISNFTKNEILKYFSIDPSKIKVVYNGCNSLPPVISVASDLSTIKKFQPYLLYVGSAYPHKNLTFLITTFIVWRKQHINYHLVLAGGSDFFYKKLIARTAQNELKYVHFLGHVQNAKLAELYKNAEAFVFPSLYEGFGMPPLEAMSHSTPVISSNTSVMPEILHESAYYFDPTKPAHLLNALNRVLFDRALKNRLIRRGAERCRIFSWEKTAKETSSLYHTY
jgi:glycosyltransferase involved in cell wall biosynthesis